MSEDISKELNVLKKQNEALLNKIEAMNKKQDAMAEVMAHNLEKEDEPNIVVITAQVTGAVAKEMGRRTFNSIADRLRAIGNTANEVVTTAVTNQEIEKLREAHLKQCRESFDKQYGL